MKDMNVSEKGYTDNGLAFGMTGAGAASGATGASGASGVAGVDSLKYLTPEALLTYVETQLRSLDGDIRKRLDGQRDLIARKKLLGDIEAAVANGGGNKEAIVAAYQAAMDALPPGDPLRATLMQGLGQATKMIPAAEWVNQVGDPSLVREMVNALNADMCKGLETSIKNELADLNAAAEINMIEVQSLMSQRATAIQLGTGMLQKINQSLEGIAKNIG